MDGAVPAVKYVEDAAERSRVQKLVTYIELMNNLFDLGSKNVRLS
jgi:hypothetical protein